MDLYRDDRTKQQKIGNYLEGKTLISKYFESQCRIIIDEYNLMCRQLGFSTNQQRREFMNEHVYENDIVQKLAYSFRNMAHIRSLGADIVVPSHGFETQVKYLRSWFAQEKKYSGRNKIGWNEVYSDFIWLLKGFLNGKKSKIALIIAWCPLTPWKELCQFGKSPGTNPLINLNRICCFPFLKHSERINSIMRDEAKERGKLKTLVFPKTPQEIELSTHWMVFGSTYDAVNIAMYF